jgi:hypothetical protein
MAARLVRCPLCREQFQAIEARAQMGIVQQEYCGLVASNSLQLRDFIAMKSDRFPLFSALLNGIFTNYSNVVSTWRQVF